jgi:hypothetical protein
MHKIVSMLSQRPGHSLITSEFSVLCSAMPVTTNRDIRRRNRNICRRMSFWDIGWMGVVLFFILPQSRKEIGSRLLLILVGILEWNKIIGAE